MWIHNAGSLAANVTSETLTSAAATASNSHDSTLAGEVSVCVVAKTANIVEYNGTLATGSVTFSDLGTLPANEPNTDTEAYVVNVYAGDERTACGSVEAGGTAAPGTSDSSSLTNAAEGGTINVSEHVTYTAS